MSLKIYLAADLHLSHLGVLKFRPEFSTIEEHDETLIANWNDTVRPKDSVWVLGDVCLNKRGLALVSQLNGLKRLIMGNHDHFSSQDYLKHFHKLHGCITKSGGVFTHIPVHPRELDRYTFNIHGHLHDENVDDPRYVNVSLEQTGMKPILMDEALLKVSF